MRTQASLDAECEYLRQCVAGIGLRAVPSVRADVYAAIAAGEELTPDQLWGRVSVAPLQRMPAIDALIEAGQIKRVRYGNGLGLVRYARTETAIRQIVPRHRRGVQERQTA